MNQKTEQLSFFPVEKQHQEIIRNWLKKEHVKEYFYGQGLENTLRSLDDFVNGTENNEDVSWEHWIAYLSDKPFGYLMTSPVKGPYDSSEDYNKWYKEGKETITLDLLIGEEEFLGKGLAHRMIQEFLRNKFSHVSKVLIDPGATNKKAIHVYEKAGFKKAEQFCPDYDPVPHWMMVLEIDHLTNDPN